MSETGGSGETTYVICLDVVRESIQSLLGRQTHPYFIAYLHLRRQAALLGRMTELPGEWSSLGPWLDVPGGPEGKPYLRPFWLGARTAQQEWLNPNLAGSFAGGSLRALPRNVIDFDGDQFSLRQDHPQRALEHLLAGVAMPALPLSAFLLRNFGIVANDEPTARDVVALFCQEFGYTDEKEFHTLYRFDPSEHSSSCTERFAL